MAVAKPPTDAEKYQHLTNQVHDHSTVLQALQVDMRHAVKLLDKLVVVADKQTELSHDLSRHSESIDRAFKQMDVVESKLVKALDTLTLTIEKDKKKSEGIAETIVGYKSSLRTIGWGGSAIIGLLVALAAMYTAQQSREADRIRADIVEGDANFERRKLATDLKFEALTQAVLEVKLSRERDREAAQSIP